jgi:hypothetical protein
MPRKRPSPDAYGSGLQLNPQASTPLIELLKPQLGREQARVGRIGLPVRAEWLGGSGELGQGLALEACDLVLEQPQSTALGGLSMHGTTAG